MTCELCNLKERTHWYHNDKYLIVCDCLTYGTPMVVWKRHTMILTLLDMNHIIAIVHKLFGCKATLGMSQREIPNHFHCHVIIG